MPFLNHLRKMDTHYQKYSIDYHLQRYPKALQHLSQCGQCDDIIISYYGYQLLVDDRFEEALSLIKTHHLYSLGLDLYSSRSEQHKVTILMKLMVILIVWY